MQGDQVVLDVSEVIDQVKQRLVDRGLTIVENVPIPDVDRQIVLLDAPQLEQARTIYAFGNPVASWLIVLVAALYLAAFVLSRRRPRTTIIIGAVLAANALLVAWCCPSVGSCSSTSWPAPCSARPARSSTTPAGVPRTRPAGAPVAWSHPGRRRVVRGSNAFGTAARRRQRWPRVGGRPARRRLSRRGGPLGRGERRLAALAPSCWASWSCSGATRSRSRGCSGRSCSWSCSSWPSRCSWASGGVRGEPARNPSPSRSQRWHHGGVTQHGQG